MYRFCCTITETLMHWLSWKSIHLKPTRPSVRPSVHPFIHPFIHSFINHLLACLLIHLLAHLLTHSFNNNHKTSISRQLSCCLGLTFVWRTAPDWRATPAPNKTWALRASLAATSEPLSSSRSERNTSGKSDRDFMWSLCLTTWNQKKTKIWIPSTEGGTLLSSHDTSHGDEKPWKRKS